MDKTYMTDVLGITNTNLQQKILLSIEEHNKINYKEDKLYRWKNDQKSNYLSIKLKMPELKKN
jgi:hypothetical protein